MRDVRLTLDHCVKCNICTTACPVAAVTPLFPGPKYVGPQAERFRLEVERAWADVETTKGEVVRLEKEVASAHAEDVNQEQIVKGRRG